MTEHGGHPSFSHIWSSDQSLYVRIRQMIAHPSSVKLIKYASVSLISTVVSQITLILVFGVYHLMSEVPANILANVLATVPSYALNRRWVWGKSGQVALLEGGGALLDPLLRRPRLLEPCRLARRRLRPGAPPAATVGTALLVNVANLLELRHPVDREVRDLQQALPRRPDRIRGAPRREGGGGLRRAPELSTEPEAVPGLQSRKLLNCSGMPKSSALHLAITSWRSSRFLAVTRSWSPWVCDDTPLSPRSLMNLFSRLA